MPRFSRDDRRRTPARGPVWGVATLVATCAVLVQLVSGCAPASHTQDLTPTAAGTPSSGKDRFPVAIRHPDGPPRIKTGTFDEKGQPVTVACGVCHTTQPANANAKLGQPTVAFHQNLVGKHGSLACVACHNPTNGYDSLRLADGRQVPYAEVMTLCAQCHGPQFRDYQHGAHGGMTGHWDLAQGGRARNNCIDCHDPHAPKYPTVSPAPGPNDRFFPGGGHE